MRQRIWRAYVRAGELKERALRHFAPSRMQFVHYSWPLRPLVCACDVDFCRYLRERNVTGKSIFHLGTGGHHLVGHENRRAALGNEVLGLTLSPREHAGYVRRVIRDPAFGVHYKVLFADLYSLSDASLPAFDLATLFHLCELSSEPGAVLRTKGTRILRLFCAKSTPGGLLLFYPGSYGYPHVAPLLAQAVLEGWLAPVEQYRSVSVFRVNGAPASPPG